MIDLHLHSTASDGTFAPGELAELGRSFAVMALTDHDSTGGLNEFLSHPDGPAIRIAGVEIDVDPGEGYGRFHLLAYGFDPSDAALQRLLSVLRSDREERNVKMVARLNGIGAKITLEDWGRFSPGLLARPHLARALVSLGYATSISDAFERLIGDDAPGYVRRTMRDPGEAIDIIHAAHGITVMAHPKFWTRDPEKLERGLAALKERGLDGLECEYQTNTREETTLHLTLAKRFGLIPTAGSDFHGSNKPGLAIGMSVPDERTFIRPFLNALGR